MREASRVVHAGLPKAVQGQLFLPGPVFAAPIYLAGDPASAAYTYGRFDNPTWNLFEKASAQAADRFLEACRMILQATSFGGLQTTAGRRARWVAIRSPADSFASAPGVNTPRICLPIWSRLFARPVDGES